MKVKSENKPLSDGNNLQQQQETDTSIYRVYGENKLSWLKISFFLKAFKIMCGVIFAVQ